MDSSSSSSPSPPSPHQTDISTMDILAAAFFVIAGAWLLIALLYSTMVLIFLRLRARGELGTVYEEDFGRLYLFRSRYYIPFGCLFRRYLRHLQAEISPISNRFMTREERRAALEELLIMDEKNNAKKGFFQQNHKAQTTSTTSATTSEVEVDTGSDDDDDDATSSSQEPLCSICLGDYEQGDCVFNSKTCSHQFHQECILDWLQRQETTADCPCCRVPMVSEDDVWKHVQKNRKQKRRKLRRKTVKNDDPVDISETCDDDDFDEEEEDMELQISAVVQEETPSSVANVAEEESP